jgi:acetyl-CoA carboxylase carboxyltransferase component
MGAKVQRLIEWFERKSKMPALEKARINLYMKRDVTSNPTIVPDDPETLRQLKEAIAKVLKIQDSEIKEIERIIL